MCSLELFPCFFCCGALWLSAEVGEKLMFTVPAGALIDCREIRTEELNRFELFLFGSKQWFWKMTQNITNVTESTNMIKI